MSFEPKSSLILNRKIKKVSMPEDYQLIFEFEDGGIVKWETEGDCCSESWFENISGLGLFRDGTVVEIIEREIPEEVSKALKPYRQDDDELYGYTLKVGYDGYNDSYQTITKFQNVDIEFRNSSNGYYGGMLEECELKPAKDSL